MSASSVAPSSSALLTAALAGLMSVSACNEKEEKEKIIRVEVAPATTAEVTKTTENLEDLTLAQFTTDCDAAGGLVELHASCSGTNSCKGSSFSYGTLIEHSCKGANTCAGMSCVHLPVDSGLTGAEILEGKRNGEDIGASVKCSFCHGEGKEKFLLPIAPGTDTEAAKASFTGKSDEELAHAIAFGIHGYRSGGPAYSNMPGFYTQYSRAEIERVVAQLRAIPLEVKVWKDPK